RLRVGEETGRRGADPLRGDHGNAVVHGPGTGGRARPAQRRPGGGRLRPGGGALRMPDWPASVPGRDADGHAPPGVAGRPGTAVPADGETAARPGDYLPEVFTQGAVEALCVGDAPGGGSRTVSVR